MTQTEKIKSQKQTFPIFQARLLSKLESVKKDLCHAIQRRRITDDSSNMKLTKPCRK